MAWKITACYHVFLARQQRYFSVSFRPIGLGLPNHSNQIPDRTGGYIDQRGRRVEESIRPIDLYRH